MPPITFSSGSYPHVRITPFSRDFSACSVALFAGRASHASRTAPETECVVSGLHSDISRDVVSEALDDVQRLESKHGRLVERFCCYLGGMSDALILLVGNDRAELAYGNGFIKLRRLFARADKCRPLFGNQTRHYREASDESMR